MWQWSQYQKCMIFPLNGFACTHSWNSSGLAPQGRFTRQLVVHSPDPARLQACCKYLCEVRLEVWVWMYKSVHFDMFACDYKILSASMAWSSSFLHGTLKVSIMILGPRLLMYERRISRHMRLTHISALWTLSGTWPESFTRSRTVSTGTRRRYAFLHTGEYCISAINLNTSWNFR